MAKSSQSDDKKKTYDYTSTQRARQRRKTLNSIAQAVGYPSWSALETAAINGEYRLPPKNG